MHEVARVGDDGDGDGDDDGAWGACIQSRSYWEERYGRDVAGGGDGGGEAFEFEWYVGWESISSLVMGALHLSPARARVLEVGCGSSRLALDMALEGGFENITAIDFAEEAISEQRRIAAKEHAKDAVRFQVEDATAMSYKDESFDVVIDKATLDTLMSNGSPFEAPRKLVAQVDRVLAPGGFYFLISHADPRDEMGETLLRDVLLSSLSWEHRWRVDIHSAGELHCYAMQKTQRRKTRSLTAKMQRGEIFGPDDAVLRHHVHE